ncbi:MAG: LacI family DNA-binding transcriptional regulator [Christensenellales bacterium]
MTIKEIAQIAGVSKATISNVLNNTGRVSEKTRERVLKVVADNQFSLNMSARILASNHSKIIGVFATDLEYLSHSVFFSKLLASIISEMKAHSYSLLLSVTGQDQLFVSSFKLDGVIVINPENEMEYTQKLIANTLPLVIVGRPFGDYDKRLSYVDVENVSIGYQMTKRLIDAGHERIVFFGGPKNYTVTTDQFTGYKKALEEAGIALNEELLLYCDYILADNYEELGKVIREQSATAIVACSDNLAVTAAKTAEKMSMSIPRDISLVCLAGTYMTEFYNPPITSANTDTKALGRKAFYKLLNIIEKKLMRTTASFADYFITEGKSIRKIN